MPLPSTLVLRPQPWTPNVYGKAISFVPGDATIPVEVQRATDAIGTGATTIATGLLFPKPGAPFVDQRANDGSSWFYRARHNGPGFDPGAYTAWVGGVVKAIPPDVLAASVNFGGASVYPIIRSQAMTDGAYAVKAASNDGLAGDRAVRVDGQGRTVVSFASTPELLPNGEFDIWESASQPHAWTVDTGDSSVAAKDASVVFSGDFAAKYSFGGGGSAGTYRGFTSNDLTKGAFCMPLRPGVAYRIKVASRVSAIGAAESYRLTLTFDAGGTLVTQQTFAYAAATTWQVDTFAFTVPATAEPNSRLAVEFTRGNTTAHDFWIDSIRVVEDVPTADLVNQLASAGQDFILNGGFEQGLAYWRKRPFGLTSANPFIDTAAPYAGAKACKCNPLANVGARMNQCDRQSDPLGTSAEIQQGNLIFIKVQPLDEIHATAAMKTDSGTNGLVALQVDEYDQNKTFIQTTLIFQTQSTTYVNLSGGIVLGATTYYIVPAFFCGGTISANLNSWIDEIHMWRVTPKDRCKVFRSAVKSVATGAGNTVMDWDSESYDVGNLHDNVTNNSRISIQDAGYGCVRLVAQIQWAAGTTGYRQVQIRKNGATILAEDSRGGTVTITTTQHCVAEDHRPAAGDYYEVVVNHTQGANLNVNNGAGVSFFTLQHIY